MKNLIGRGDVGFLYGPSSAGKTFIAIDLAFAMALGLSHWCGYRLREGAILHCAFEGGRGLQKRLVAARNAHGDPGSRYAALEVRGSLSGEDVRSTIAQICAATSALADMAETPVSLIVIDTLSSAAPGSDENAAQDMSAFVALLKEIAAQTGAAVLCIHHTGKDHGRGMRGSNSLYANADFVIELTEAKDLVAAKSREGKRGPIGAFDLEEVELGVDDDGDRVTSCIVRHRAPHPRSKKASKALTGPSRAALEILERLYTDHKARRVAPPMIGGADVPKCVRLIDWRKACRDKELSTTDPADERKKTEAEDKAFQRAKEKLEEANLIGAYGGEVWLLEQRSRNVRPEGTEGTEGTFRPPMSPEVGRTEGTPPYRGVPVCPPRLGEE